MSVPDWVKYVFDYSDFRPRGQCGKWEDPWLGMYMHGHLLVFLAYAGIFIVLMSSVKLGKKNREAMVAAVTYATFILLCGGSHLVDGIVVFEYPMYRAIALYNDLLAAVSLFALLVTIRIRNKFIVVFE